MVERIILKFAAVGTALLLGLAAPAAAGPRDDDSPDTSVDTSVDAGANAASSRYDSPEVIQKIGKASRWRDANPAAPRRSTETRRVYRPRPGDCFDCQPRRRYDDQKVVKKVRNVDYSRVINTVTVVPARRVREVNRLVIRNNETRYVGVVRHNHTIVEKEIRYVQRAPNTTTVNFVTHNYRVVERPAMASVPSRNYECGVGMSRYQNSCGPTLRVRD